VIIITTYWRNIYDVEMFCEHPSLSGVQTMSATGPAVRASSVRSAVLMVVTMKSAVFEEVIPCSLVEVYWHFGGRYCLYHQG
jgi:hypothetical protein